MLSPLQHLHAHGLHVQIQDTCLVNAYCSIFTKTFSAIKQEGGLGLYGAYWQTAYDASGCQARKGNIRKAALGRVQKLVWSMPVKQPCINAAYGC